MNSCKIDQSCRHLTTNSIFAENYRCNVREPDAPGMDHLNVAYLNSHSNPFGCQALSFLCVLCWTLEQYITVYIFQHNIKREIPFILISQLLVLLHAPTVNLQVITSSILNGQALEVAYSHPCLDVIISSVLILLTL